MHRFAFLIAVALGCSGCNSGSGNAGSGTTPSGPTFTTFDVPGALTQPGTACGTAPMDINANSVIVGNWFDPVQAQYSNGTTQGFIRASDGTLTIVGLQDSSGLPVATSVVAINSSGTILGSAPDEAFTRTADGQYSYLPLTSFDLPVLGLTPVLGLQPTSINDGGQFVGFFFDKNADSHAFIAPTGGLQTIFGGTFTPPYEYGSSASHINVNGDVVGWVGASPAGSGGFLYHANGDKSIVILNAPASGPVPLGTAAIDINSSGSIVGTAADTATHSFLRTSDGTYTVFDPPGATSSTPVRINSSGQIVGNFQDNVSVSHGYLRNTDGTITVIDGPGTVPASGYGTFVTSINDSGTIVGYFYDYKTDCHGFIRTP
jgi:hypothetical protein